jgi:hypothetical protein
LTLRTQASRPTRSDRRTQFTPVLAAKTHLA